MQRMDYLPLLPEVTGYLALLLVVVVGVGLAGGKDESQRT